MYHAALSLERAVAHQLGDFDLGFAYEAMARAYAVKGDAMQRDAHLSRARACAARVADPKDRAWLVQNLDAVPAV